MERRLQREIDQEFSKQADFVIAEMEKIYPKKNIDEDEVDEIFVKLDNTAVENSILAEAAVAMTFGGNFRARKNRLTRLGIDFRLDHPLAVEYLESDRPLLLAKMTETTKQHIKPIIVRGAAEGLSPQQVAKQISENFAFSKTRSIMIASNEIGNAYEFGNYVTMKTAEEQGFKSEKQWLTVGDDRVTATHTENEDQGWIPLDETFKGTGDQQAPASDNPRCRCTTEYRIIS